MPARGKDGPKMMELLERAYDSAFEPRPFASLLPHLAEAVGADAAHISMWVPELDAGELAASHAMPEHLIRIYREHHWRHDLWRHALERRKIPVGGAFAGHEIVPFATLEKSEMYNDALRGYGLFDTCGGRVFERGSAGGAVSLLRARWRPFYGRREVARLGAVLPHMARAFRMRLQLDELARQRDAFAAFLENAAAGAFLVEHGGGLVHATAKGRDLLDDPNGPLRLVRGRLCARDAVAERRLRQQIAGRQGAASWLFERAVIDLPPAHRMRIVASRFSGGLLALAHAAFVVIVESAQRSPRDAAEAAARRHGLTPAESELLRELVAGRSLAACAEQLARRITTVRNQLQSIFSKTGTRRQAELVAKVLGNAG